MSKASEWVEQYRERAERWPKFTINGQTVALVDTVGNLVFEKTPVFKANEALALADWIKDTFGEMTP